MNTIPTIGFDNLQDEPKLLLDDERSVDDVFGITKEVVYTYPNWHTVRTYDEFVKYITTNPMPAIISLDHDLGDVDVIITPIEGDMEKQAAWDAYHSNPNRERTGYDALKWLVNYCFDKELVFPRLLIHTQNPVGYDNMQFYFRNAVRNKMIKFR